MLRKMHLEIVSTMLQEGADVHAVTAQVCVCLAECAGFHKSKPLLVMLDSTSPQQVDDRTSSKTMSSCVKWTKMFCQHCF